MSWYYGEWNDLQSLITAVTVLVAAATLVVAFIALVRSHRHPATDAVGTVTSAPVPARVPTHQHNGHRAA
jgi:hypothetical protein